VISLITSLQADYNAVLHKVKPKRFEAYTTPANHQVALIFFQQHTIKLYRLETLHREEILLLQDSLDPIYLAFSSTHLPRQVVSM